MPAYQDNPFQIPQLVQKGVPCYLFGSLNLHQGPTVMLVSQVALATNVATLTVQITAGEVPTVGSLISVQQTATNGGAFNVNRAALTAVSINAQTGAGTVSYALTHANVTLTADPGSAVVEVPELSETLANGNSAACLFQASEAQVTVPVAVTFPTMPTAASVDLQMAIHNQNSEYTKVATVVVVSASAYTSGPTNQVTLQRGYFYRFAVSGVSGAGTVIAKIGG